MLVTAAIFSAILGQPVDGPQNGQAPPPWSIPCQAQALFNTETRFIEIPHTASVKVIFLAFVLTSIPLLLYSIVCYSERVQRIVGFL